MAGTIDTERPSLSDMREWRDQVTGNHIALDSEVEKEEKLYFQDFDIEAPGGKLAVKTGSAPADVDAAIDSLTPTEVMVKVRPVRAKEKYAAQAEKLQKLALGLIHAWRKPKDNFRMVASDMCGRRIGIARVLWDETRRPDPPKGLTGDDLDDWKALHWNKCPIVFEPRNPRLCAWEDQEGLPVVLVEQYEATVLEVWNALGHWPNVKRWLTGLGLEMKVTVDDVWTETHRAIFINDNPVFGDEDDGVLPHGYRRIPYVIFPFRELHFEEPEKRYRGMLTNASELYPLESNVLTMHTWMLAWNAWRTYKGWLSDGRDVEIVPGQIVPLDTRKGEYLEMLEGNPVPPELLQTAGVVDQYIQRNGVAQGPRSADGTRSAQQVWALQSMRQVKIEPAKQALQSGLEQALEIAAMIVDDRCKEDKLILPLPGRTRDGDDMGEVVVGAKDVAGYYSGFEVSFGRRMDPAVLEQAKSLMALAQNNWMPMDVSWELSGLTDSPQEWEDKLTVQAVERLPFIIELAGLMRAKKWFGDDSEIYQRLVQKVMESQQQSPGGMPGAPGVPSPGGMQPNGIHGGGDTTGPTDQGMMALPQPPAGPVLR